MTKVIFRKAKNPYTGDYDVIAFFPDEEANYGKILCYEHMGQHSEADILYYKYETKKATPEEYADLYRELTELVGYEDLKIMQKFMRR